MYGTHLVFTYFPTKIILHLRKQKKKKLFQTFFGLYSLFGLIFGLWKFAKSHLALLSR